jgi:hypothetical protein
MTYLVTTIQPTLHCYDLSRYSQLHCYNLFGYSQYYIAMIYLVTANTTLL